MVLLEGYADDVAQHRSAAAFVTILETVAGVFCGTPASLKPDDDVATTRHHAVHTNFPASSCCSPSHRYAHRKPPFATLQSTQAMFWRRSSGREPLSQ